jgi:hypothetical protein
VTRPGLRVIEGSLAAARQPATADPRRFQQECVEAYLASWVARGFSPVTIENDSGVLERMLALLDRPAWEVTADDIDRVAGSLAVSGLAASTRRGYVQAFKGFHRFLSARKAAEIEAMFGIRIECPVDEFNASRHVGDDSPGQLPPPSAARVEGFFAFLRGRIATARKYGPAARDYALFRTSVWLPNALAHVSMTPWSSSSPRSARGAETTPSPAQAPPPNPTAAGPDGGRVLSRVGLADHAVTPEAPWTGSGWREYSYGGFGGGHPHFRLHADGRQPGLTDSICQPRSAAESEILDRRPAAGWHRWLAHAVLVPGLSEQSDRRGEDEDHGAPKGHERLCGAA